MTGKLFIKRSLFLLSFFMITSCSKEPVEKQIFEFYISHPSYSKVEGFSKYQIIKRDEGYLIGFPKFNSWFVYRFDQEHPENIQSVSTSRTDSILEANQILKDSLKTIAEEKLKLFTRYNLVKIDGHNGKVIEFSFSHDDVLSYINITDSLKNERISYWNKKATKLCEDVYYYKREVPLEF